MDYLQYLYNYHTSLLISFFTPVLNLIINGLPSIPPMNEINDIDLFLDFSFKPYYKWITFNTHARRNNFNGMYLEQF